LSFGAQQRVAARGDDVVPGAAGQVRHRLRVEHRALARELDRAAIVAAMDDRLDARPRRVGARVDVGDQAHHGVAPAGRRRQRGHHVAVVVERGVLEPDRLELVDEHA
jgi:hypothetical protein